MNVQLKDITVTARDGRVSHLDQVYIRGSHVRFIIVPDMLRQVIFPLQILNANELIETHQCSDPRIRKDEGLGSHGGEPLSVELAVRGVASNEHKMMAVWYRCKSVTR
jgi:hypothetical protein